MNVMQGPNDGSADLTDATRRCIADEASKTQAWIDANRPDGGHGTSLLDAQEAMRHWVPVRDTAGDDTGGDDIDRAERAFWDGIDYSKLGDAEAVEGGGGS